MSVQCAATGEGTGQHIQAGILDKHLRAQYASRFASTVKWQRAQRAATELFTLFLGAPKKNISGSCVFYIDAKVTLQLVPQKKG